MRIFVVALLAGLSGCATTLHKEPADTLRLRILSETPKGTSLADVRKVANQYDAGCIGGLHERGMNRDTGLLPLEPKEARYFVQVCAGSGWAFPFRAYTFITWYLDEGDRLLDVRVQRQADAI